MSSQHPNTHSRKYTGLVDDHVQVLFLFWYGLPIVPVDIPILAKVDVAHLLKEDLLNLVPSLVRLNELRHLQHG